MNLKKIFTAAALVTAMAALAGCGGAKTNTATKDATSKPEAASDLAYIKDKGKMIVGYTIINPLNYRDADGKLTGFETDFANAVSEKLGVKTDFQEIDWDSKEIELSSKKIDCIWNGMTITDELKANTAITVPYMENRQVLIVKADNKDKYTASLDGAKVAAEAGSAGEALATSSNENFKGSSFTPVDSQAKALMDVASGVSDVAVIDYIMSTGSVGEGTDYANLVVIDKNFEGEEYGVAFRKGSDAAEAVNKAMKELKEEGKLDEIAAKYNLKDLLIIK